MYGKLLWTIFKLLHNINVGTVISVYVQFLMDAVSLSGNFMHLQFYRLHFYSG